MPIAEAQLDTWSKQGAPGPSRETYAAVKKILEDTAAPYAGKNPEVFLQGSYGNDTNVARDSDVDAVALIPTTFAHDAATLSAEQYQAFENTYVGPASYSYSQYKNDVLTWLTSKYGNGVRSGRKAIYIPAGQNRRECDVLPAIQYRRYYHFRSAQDQKYASGICFYLQDGTQIVNFPKQHSDNCTTKHQSTNSWFKPSVRIYKNMRNYMIERNMLAEGVAPSYFIEGMLYNVPNDRFGTSFEDTFVHTYNYLNSADRSRFKCANEIHALLGTSSVTWRAENCVTFLEALKALWISDMK
ncbi:nucleotidyltransferase [Bradyrhizobium sp. SEMIA]|uniref:nucleotidyltransferase domain-containing protein n=1 Tax=Bradyrhizobium sp. SEMIA TaxID=2597515 RepID=UPI00223FCC66|nr:nucleotidyltransferase [Bradyrhizobium sp. SEMIA]